MAQKTWLGTTNGDFNTTSNYVEAAVPVANDVLVFPATGAVRGPNASMAAHAAIDLDAFIVQAGFPFDVGLSGSPAEISADRVEIYGGRQVWLKDGSPLTDEVFVAVGPDTILVNLAGDTMTNISIASGQKIVIGSTIGNIAQLIIGGWGQRPNVTIEGNTNTLADLIMLDGQLESEMIVTRAQLANGTWRTLGAKTAGTINNLGGLLRYDSTGTITLLNAAKGETDLGLKAKTVTAARVLPGAVLRYTESLVTFTASLIDFRKGV